MVLIHTLMLYFDATGGYLPCDPDYPDDRLSIYLEDAKAPVLLTQVEHLSRARSLVGDDCRVLEVQTVLSEVAGAPGNPPADRSSYDGVAYVIFTSGSTGRPKGVQLPHRGVADLIPWLPELHGLGRYCMQFHISFFSLCYPALCAASTSSRFGLTLL